MFQNVVEENRRIGDIPCLCFYPSDNGVYPTVVLYHGWSSNKYNQRFLGSILATQGFFVAAPDAPRHGERDALDFESPEPVRSYFWEVVLAAVQEAPALLTAVAGWDRVDSSRLGLVGISMGAFIGSAVFSGQPDLKAFVSLIGTGAWLQAADTWDPRGEFPTADQREQIEILNPAVRAREIGGRPVLLLHGDEDSVVDVHLQRQYYNMLTAHSAGAQVSMMETEGLGHYLELDMIETASGWLAEHLAQHKEG